MIRVVSGMYNPTGSIMRSSRDSSEEHMLSLVDNHSENEDLGPDELSGDENGEESVIASLTSRDKHKASTAKVNRRSPVDHHPREDSDRGGHPGPALHLQHHGHRYDSGPLLGDWWAGLLHGGAPPQLQEPVGPQQLQHDPLPHPPPPHRQGGDLDHHDVHAPRRLYSIPYPGIVDLLLLKSTLRKILVDVLGAEHAAIDQFYTSEHMIVLVVAVLELPLVLLNKIEKLRFFAFFGVSGVLVFILAFLAYFIMEVVQHEGAIKPVQAFPDDWYKAIAAIPSILFSLTFQNNFFPIFKGLLDPSDSRMRRVLLGGVGTCVSWYLVVGFLGYLLSNGNLTPNYLQSVPYHSTSLPIFILMNGGFLVSLFCALPIIFFTSKNNFMALLKVCTTREKPKGWRPHDDSDNIDDVSSFVESTEKTARRRKAKVAYVVQTLVLYLCLLTVGYLVDSLEEVLNLVGAVGCASISIILPAYYYIRLVGLRGKAKTYKYYVAWGMFLFMIPFTIFSVVALYI